MDTADLARELWSIANIITGFAVMQGLGFCLALGGNLGRLQSQSFCVKSGLGFVCLIFSALYAYAVWQCANLALDSCLAGKVGGQDLASVWQSVTYGRISAIGLFSAVLPILALFAKNCFQWACRVGQ